MRNFPPELHKPQNVLMAKKLPRQFKLNQLGNINTKFRGKVSNPRQYSKYTLLCMLFLLFYLDENLPVVSL